MPIMYSLSRKPVNPGDPSSDTKVYATLQYTGVMKIKKFAKHISDHHCVFDLPTIEGVLNKAVECARELLLQGYEIELAGLGFFYCSISSRGVEKASDFNPDTDITSLRVNWRRGSDLKNMLKEAEFEFTTTRAEQAEAKKQRKLLLDSDLPDADGDSGSSTDGGNTDTGDTGRSGSGSTESREG